MGNAISFQDVYALIDEESAPLSADTLFHDPESIFEDGAAAPTRLRRIEAADGQGAEPAPLRGGIVPV